MNMLFKQNNIIDNSNFNIALSNSVQYIPSISNLINNKKIKTGRENV